MSNTSSILLLAAPRQPLLLPARVPVIAERPTYSASEAPKAPEVQTAPTGSYKVYAKAPNGEVFVRSSNKSYPFAVIFVGNDGKAGIRSWHSRIDLAQRAARLDSRRIAVPTSRQKPDGTCGNCHGTGQIRCSKCHGEPEKDITTRSWDKDLVTGQWSATEKFSHHFSCTCKTGKRKCHVCGGKGVFKAVRS